MVNQKRCHNCNSDQFKLTRSGLVCRNCGFVIIKKGSFKKEVKHGKKQED